MFEPRLVPTIRKRVASSDGDDIKSNLRRIDVNLGNNHALKEYNQFTQNTSCFGNYAFSRNFCYIHTKSCETGIVKKEPRG